MSLKIKTDFTLSTCLNGQNAVLNLQDIEFSVCRSQEIQNNSEDHTYYITDIKGDFVIKQIRAAGIKLWYKKDKNSFFLLKEYASSPVEFHISADVEFKKASLNLVHINLVNVSYPLCISKDFLQNLQPCEYFENSFALPAYDFMKFKYFIKKKPDDRCELIIQNPTNVEINGQRGNFIRTLDNDDDTTINLKFIFDPLLKNSSSPLNQNSFAPVVPKTKVTKPSFYEIMTNSKYFDVILVSSDHVEVKTHRCLLDKFSKIFAQIIADSNESKEQLPIKIKVDEFGADIIQAALDFLYDKTDSILGKESKVFTFASAYDIQILKDTCCDHFVKTVNHENACEFIEIAYANKFEELKQKCQKLIASNKNEIDPLKLKKLPKDIIVDIFYV